MPLYIRLYTVSLSVSEHLLHDLSDHSSSTKVFKLLFALHPLGSQYSEDGVLTQKMAYQHAAEHNIMPLLSCWPDLALGLNERFKKLKTCLVVAVLNFSLHVVLEKVEAAEGAFLSWRRVLCPYFLEQAFRFGSLLQETQNLIDFIWDNISILIFFDNSFGSFFLTTIWDIFQIFHFSFILSYFFLVQVLNGQILILLDDIFFLHNFRLNIGFYFALFFQFQILFQRKKQTIIDSYFLLISRKLSFQRDISCIYWQLVKRTSSQNDIWERRVKKGDRI